MVVDHVSDYHPMYLDPTVTLRREILQIKLATVLHKYHLSERNGHPEDPLTAMFDWIQVHAKGYDEQFYRSYDSIMGVCDRLCGNGCQMRRKSTEISNHPEILETCPFPFDILHALLRDGYPIEYEQANATYRSLVGKDLPSDPFVPDS